MGKIRHYRGARLGWALLVWLPTAFGAAPMMQTADPPLEYRVKAAFLLNFTKFVEWPDSAGTSDSPLSICIWGKDPYGGALEKTIDGEVVGSRKLKVERFSQLPAPSACRVVFVSSSEKDIPRTLSNIGPGVLTVGEGDRFVRDGGMIGFVIVGGHVRFDINQKAATEAGLKLSSKLLSVARSIEK